MVRIFTSSRYKINRKRVARVATETLEKGNFDAKMVVNVVFVGKRKMKEIAIQYKSDEIVHPVLSFCYTQDEASAPIVEAEAGSVVLGEVVVCYPQAIMLAAEKSKTVDKTIDELVKHGVENIVRYR